ncbi:FAD-dependent monooxygenase [Nocardia sp. NBC_00511]|uniref:FAD-dependent monooxygenase n=1 Tax=Nocardia sp. NBC_00511 TaxID=2903591 RepID=UPI002F9155A8
MVVEVDVLVIGCGPAGLIAADRLSDAGARVLLVDAGRGHTRRVCPVDRGRECHGCRGICNTVAGFGGCIHYGDGVKLSRFPSGRRLAELLGGERGLRLETAALHRLCGTVLPEFRGSVGAAPWPVKDYPVASLTSAQVRAVIDGLHNRLLSRPSIDLRTGTEVRALAPHAGGRWQAQLLDRRGSEDRVRARAVVAAVGRWGREWWHAQIRTLGLRFDPPAPSVGVRFECPAALLAAGAGVHADFKTTLVRSGVKIKTFCFCAGPGGGRIKFTDYPAGPDGGYTLLDGHVIAEPAHGATANFALLAQLRDEDGRAWDSTRIATDLLAPYRALRPDRPGKPVLQWFPDFKARELTCTSLPEFSAISGVTPSVRDYRMANLASILPSEVHAALVEAFTDLAGFFTGGADPAWCQRQVGVIGLELENTWDVMDLSASLQTSAPGLYAVGDATGLAQGIVAAATGGLAAAEHIVSTSLSTPVTEGLLR